MQVHLDRDDFQVPKMSISSLVLMGKKIHVQDDIREKMLISYIQVTEDTESRNGRDAYLNIDGDDKTIEIKSTTRNNVATARQVDIEKIKKWRKQYWVIGYGPQTKNGFVLQELYICHPVHINEAFLLYEDKIRRNEIVAQEVLDHIRSHWDPVQFKKVEYLFKNGCRRNNAPIPMKLVRRNGMLLPIDNSDEAHRQVVEFIRQHPLDVWKPLKKKKVKFCDLFGEV